MMSEKALIDMVGTLTEEHCKLRADYAALRGVVCAFIAKIAGVKEEAVSELIHAREQQSRDFMTKARTEALTRSAESNIVFLSVDAQAAELLRMAREDWDAIAPGLGDDPNMEAASSR